MHTTTAVSTDRHHIRIQKQYTDRSQLLVSLSALRTPTGTRNGDVQ